MIGKCGDYHHRSTEARFRAAGCGQLGPPNIALSDYHSDLARID